MDGWWAGEESNLYSRRRLIYSQLSSPPAQPTHGEDRPGVAAAPWWRPDEDPVQLEPTTGLEPGTGGLQNRCSTN